MTKLLRAFSRVLIVGAVLLLSGCKMALFNPAGTIAHQEMWLLIESTVLMLVIAIPVTIMVIVIAIKYRAGNKKAEYKPNWSHSYTIEAFCWSIPCAIILILGIMTWESSHALDPYKPITVHKNKKTLVVQAIALDWRWMFIYPQKDIASLSYLQIPIDTPIRVEITADAPMNSLEIPRLAGQIYAMGGMRTNLYIDATKIGMYKGFSTNYSGDGFAGMKFKIKASRAKDFNAWVAKVQRSSDKLTWARYLKLSEPSTNRKPMVFSHVEKHLFHRVIMLFMMPAKDNKAAILQSAVKFNARSKP